jgi:hypothetical protein
MSQNRPRADVEGVIDGYERSGDTVMAEQVRGANPQA